MIPTETQILKAVCDYLSYKKYNFWRQNNVGVFDSKNKIYRKMPKYSMLGVSDIIILIDGQAHFMEIKTKKGVQSENQKNFQDFVQKAGCNYYIIRSLDDLIKEGF